jgi:serine/threonine protein phosphatase 1
MSSRIAIGDCHGCYTTFLALLDKLPKDIPITLVGDLIDRGPDSNKVMQYAIDNKIDTVSGNHEKMMQQFFKDYPQSLNGEVLELREEDLFLLNGGNTTLRSYGFIVKVIGFTKFLITPPNDLTQIKSHLEFIKKLPLFIEYPDCVNSEGRMLVVSHSSINAVWHYRNDPSRKDQVEQTILWGRPSTIKDVPEIYGIFGHTPQEFGPRIKVPFANIDTGCCFKYEGADTPSYSKLTALMYPEMELFIQDNVEE